jgi:hypothetical protein
VPSEDPGLGDIAHPDAQWEELFAQMRCARDQALLACYVSSAQRALSISAVRTIVQRAGKALVPTHPEFAYVRFSPHDFRRLFATEPVNTGLPIHIGAALLGHLNVQTTRGYVAIFEEDVVRHYQEFLDRRRARRPDGEYRQPTPEEWDDFTGHFDKRKVELGSCGRPYGTPCQHEHACVRLRVPFCRIERAIS